MGLVQIDAIDMSSAARRRSGARRKAVNDTKQETLALHEAQQLAREGDMVRQQGVRGCSDPLCVHRTVLAACAPLGVFPYAQVKRLTPEVVMPRLRTRLQKCRKADQKAEVLKHVCESVAKVAVIMPNTPQVAGRNMTEALYELESHTGERIQRKTLRNHLDAYCWLTCEKGADQCGWTGSTPLGSCTPCLVDFLQGFPSVRAVCNTDSQVDLFAGGVCTVPAGTSMRVYLGGTLDGVAHHCLVETDAGVRGFTSWDDEKWTVDVPAACDLASRLRAPAAGAAGEAPEAEAGAGLTSPACLWVTSEGSEPSTCVLTGDGSCSGEAASEVLSWTECDDMLSFIESYRTL